MEQRGTDVITGCDSDMGNELSMCAESNFSGHSNLDLSELEVIRYFNNFQLLCYCNIKNMMHVSRNQGP